MAPLYCASYNDQMSWNDYEWQRLEFLILYPVPYREAFTDSQVQKNQYFLEKQGFFLKREGEVGCLAEERGSNLYTAYA